MSANITSVVSVRGDDKGHWKRDERREAFTGCVATCGTWKISLWLGLLQKKKKLGTYLQFLTAENIFGPQDEVLGMVQQSLASPQHLDREGVGEKAAWLTCFLRQGQKWCVPAESPGYKLIQLSGIREHFHHFPPDLFVLSQFGKVYRVWTVWVPLWSQNAATKDFIVIQVSWCSSQQCLTHAAPLHKGTRRLPIWILKVKGHRYAFHITKKINHTQNWLYILLCVNILDTLASWICFTCELTGQSWVMTLVQFGWEPKFIAIRSGVARPCKIPWIWARSSKQSLDWELGSTYMGIEIKRTHWIRNKLHYCVVILKTLIFIAWLSPECAASDDVVREEDGCSRAGVRGTPATLWHTHNGQLTRCQGATMHEWHKASWSNERVTKREVQTM